MRRETLSSRPAGRLPSWPSLSALLLALSLTACGGSGSDSATTPGSNAGAGGASQSTPAGNGSTPTTPGASTPQGGDASAPTTGSSTPTSGASTPTGSDGAAAAPAKSAKRGIAYDLSSTADLSVLSPGVSWWYNWSPKPSGAVPADYRSRYGMDFIPMLWNDSFNASEVEAFLKANPSIKYLLVLNEPNLVDQANKTPQQVAAFWPNYEAVAAHTGVKIVGPAITWGTMSGYSDPVVWMDAFYAAYRSQHGRDPQIDYIAFHWYDYGLASQLDRLKKYNKPFWVTEFANWHNGDGSAQIDSVAKQKTQMQDMVAVCEGRADVFRYAWFTGRWANDTHYTSLLGANGQLTDLGKYYLSLPYAK